MRFGHILLFLTAFTMTWSAGALAAVAAKKTPAKKAPVAAKKSTGKAVSGKAAPAKAGTKAASGKAAPRKGGKAVAVKAAPFRSRQMQPTQERYKEIQEALVAKGYLKSEPTGVWGPESVDALKQFQTEQNIQPTGKLNSRSIIGLGLGPKTAGPLVVPPPEPSSTRPQQ